MADTVRQDLVRSLTDLAAAREYAMAYPEPCPAMISGVTHCESCGFHYSVARHVVAWRGLCATPELHEVTL